MFGDVPVGQTSQLTVTVDLAEGESLEAAEIEGDPSFFQFDTSDCVFVTGPQTCDITVSFTPDAVGDFFAELELRSADDSTLVPLFGNGVLITTSTTLESLPNPSDVGESVTLTATVTADLGPGIPEGSVTFSDDGSPLGSELLDAAGSATLEIGFTSAGEHTITAMYLGSDLHDGSSDTLSQVVTAISTTTTLESSPNPSVVGDSVTLTATVAASSGTATPEGSVTFTDDSTELATVALSGGSAGFSTSLLGAGEHTITATYSGSEVHEGSSDSLTQTVQGAPELLAALLEKVIGVGPGSSLADKVRKAQDFVEAGKTKQACKTLDDFISEVRAQSGKSLSAGLAEDLIADAQQVQTVLGC